MKIKPLFDRVIVEITKQDVSASGIFIGTSSQDKPLLGKVLYVGEGLKNQDGHLEPMLVNVGNTVLFSKFSGVDTILDNKTVYILRQTDILAIIE